VCSRSPGPTRRSSSPRVSRLTGLELGVFRGGRLLAATVEGVGPRAELGGSGEPRDFRLGEQQFRGRAERVTEPVGPPVELAVFRDSSALGDRIARNRLLIGGLLLVFLLLALASAAFVGRALERQIGEFLSAARRLGRGDFAQPVPVEGNDEFAQLGREFKQHVEAARGEDRGGRAQAPGARGDDSPRWGRTRHGARSRWVGGARNANRAGRVQRRRRMGVPARWCLPRDDRGGNRRPSRGCHGRGRGADAHPGCKPGGSNPARRRRVASRKSRVPTRSPSRSLAVTRLLTRGARAARFLAGQAAVSIENASLHEAVERQAVTDELTGLANTRRSTRSSNARSSAPAGSKVRLAW
jgi:HAMP domain-containing protein